MERTAGWAVGGVWLACAEVLRPRSARGRGAWLGEPGAIQGWDGEGGEVGAREVAMHWSGTREQQVGCGVP